MPRNPSCRACPLYANAANVCVWGEHRGEPSDIMIVGEAPGYNEDTQGRPFVGDSGSLLKEAILDQLPGAYITNVVKCRSYGQPKPAQVKACRGYLDEELREVKPRFVLALGNTAYHHFGSGAITQNAGREFWSDKYQCWVIPALHPAAILRDVSRKPAWLLDLGRFKQLTVGGLVESPPVAVSVVRTPGELVFLTTQLRHSKGFAFDFEATPCEWWDKGWKPISIAFAWEEGKATVVPLYHPESPLDKETIDWFFAAMRDVMTDERLPKTAHNMLYDDLAWYRCAGYLPHTTFDSMVACQILDENQPKGLKWQGRSRLGWPQWDIDIRDAFDDLDHYDKGKTRERLSRSGPVLDGRWVIKKGLEEIARYNGYDAAATYLLRQKVLGDLKCDAGLLQYFVHLEMPKLRALERLIRTGIHVDQEALTQRIQEAESRLVDAAMQIPVQNPGSTKQLQAWLYGELGITPVKYTPAGQPSTDEETVKILAREHPEVRKVLEYRKWQKYLSTYLRPLADSLRRSFDGRIHPEYRSTSVETGRLASSFHTTPRDSFIRSIFAAPPGWSLVQGDYAQIEARLAAWAASGKPATFAAPKDRAGITPSSSIDPIDHAPASRSMLAAFLTGLDVYVETAARILKKPQGEVTTDKADPNNERQVMGKVPTLASLYRISAKGLQAYAWREYEIIWSMEEASTVWRGFLERWPEFPAWHAREERILKARGYAVSALGRRRRLPAAQSDDEKLAHEAINAGINAPIQSLASDITQTAMILLDKLIRERRLTWIRIVGNVHDALLIEVRNDYLKVGTELLRSVMLSSPNKLRVLGLRLPPGLIDVEISVGPWGDGRKV